MTAKTYAVKEPFKFKGTFYQPGHPERGSIDLDEEAYRALGQEFTTKHLGPINRIEYQRAIRVQRERAVAEAEGQVATQKASIKSLEDQKKAAAIDFDGRIAQAKDDLKALEARVDDRRKVLDDFNAKALESGDASKPEGSKPEGPAGGVHVENAGLPAPLAEKLKAAGFATVASLRKASDEELRKARVTAAELKQIREAVPAEEGGKS